MPMPIGISQEAAEILHQMMREVVAANERAHALASAVLAAWPPGPGPGRPELPPERNELVRTPGGGLSSPCQVLVQNLFAEARVFHGAVPAQTRHAWLEAIEACKGKIPESEYDQA